MVGFFHMGENLKQSRPFCDLSLYFHPKDLLEALKNPSKMSELSEKILKMSVEVSEELSRQIQDENDSRNGARASEFHSLHNAAGTEKA